MAILLGSVPRACNPSRRSEGESRLAAVPSEGFVWPGDRAASLAAPAMGRLREVRADAAPGCCRVSSQL